LAGAVTFEPFVGDGRPGDVGTFRAPNDPAGIAATVARLRTLVPALIVAEETGGYEWALDALAAAGLPLVVATSQALSIAGHLGGAAFLSKTQKAGRASLRQNFESTISDPNFDHEKMHEVASATQEVANAIKKHYGGGIQTFLRAHGERMVKELSEILQNAGISNAKAGRIARLWLQNVANMPVLSTSDKHVKEYLRKNKLTPTQLMKKADAIGVSVAYLDDILLVEHQRKRKVARRKTIR
jgi:hypothetical protein